MKLKSILLGLLFASTTAFAQKPDLTYNVGGKVNFIKLTDGGVLIAASSDGLFGIKPDQNQMIFSFTNYGKVKEDELTFTPMSPFVTVNQGKWMTPGASKKKTVIDYMTGKEIFVSEKLDWVFVSTLEIFPEQDIIVVSGNQAKNGNGLAVYKLSDGTQLGFVKLKATQSITTPSTIIDGGLLVGTAKSLLRIDIANSSIVWENKDIDNTYKITSDKTGKEIYAFEAKGSDTRVHKISSNGEKLWNKERKIKGRVTRFEILPQGLVLTSDEGGKADTKIAFLNANDGTDFWEKAPKSKGFVTHFYILDDGILYGLQQGGINKISFDGKQMFKKPFKTGADIDLMAKTPKGLFFITSTDCNILNLETGEEVWKKDLKFKKTATVTNDYDEEHHRYLISNGKELMAIDENTGDISKLASFSFRGDEYPTSLTVRKSGILLSSSQNMILFDFDGKEKYKVFYKAPGKSFGGALLAGVAMTAAVGMSATSAASAQAHRNVNYVGGGNYALGDYTSYGKSLMNSSKSFAKNAGGFYGEMTKRFSASAATEGSQFILTKLDDGVGLVKINKDSGVKEKEIVLKDKTPMYEVDDIGGYLFFANGKEVQVFDLKK